MNTPNDLKSQFLTETISSFDVLDEIVSVVENTECVDCLASTVTEELTCIEESYLPKEDNYSVPDTTKEEWVKSNEQRKSYKEIKEFVDEDILNAAKGFMVGPVGIFRGKIVAAESQVFEDIHEMKIFLLNVQCKTKDMVLYMTYTTERTDFGGKDSLSFSCEELQKLPKVPVYCFRGKFVDKI
jgi:hypothetical protein